MDYISSILSVILIVILIWGQVVDTKYRKSRIQKRTLTTKTAPAAIGPYSQAISVSDFIFTSGQIPLDADGNLVAGGIKEQTEQCIKNINAILSAKGCNLDNVVKTTVFLSDMSNFADMNEVYAKFFTEKPPARSTVEVSALPKSALIEIECVVVNNQ
jgi:2-iminobutanoate/2-iminopropanoate deaminase